MKAIILAGGYGSRLGDITNVVPKPMIDIGGKPILWHIMKIYSYYGINDFIICLGYKADVIKDYFLHYDFKNNDFTIEIGNGNIEFLNTNDEKNWKVTLIDTGISSEKGARLKKIEKYLEDDINLLTYGDGLANINVKELIGFHNSMGKLLTISGVRPPARFGELVADGNVLESFEEKSQTSKGLINGGFMVFNKKLLEFLTEDDNCDLEYGLFEDLAKNKEIAVYKHEGLWACMDNERDMNNLNMLWKNNNAFWRLW
ncbi:MULTISPECIES: glucose-1-phosphate cytidylyltransferase [unclassified Clostridioides]|uniref:glucose-1-phosphate cytidylyltransferase n=1 Tax=unclassified Clostridioides TaxID=2635829 RepID=UPI001D123AAB|nr:glucose-1-phosphate cytidylyltransferase [Clostridioides sp. ES-S-0171-01]MCC0688042.1 glucose-1-phosphate cytidylyltransferase [Clostridioides sp. ES-S-0056-01]MCC0715257.1 glucose-1-phosphate cytidylyltransferase [Clostridioides sp. ES-S-0077-01]UDN54957.1 glucose-1-phosphate cytidylyltransferase [Clostridioides sp. ES-S-0054-01]